MILPFVELPNPDGSYVSRPAAYVRLEGLDLPLLCIIDSGANKNRFGVDIARAAGIDLPQPDAGKLAVGGERDITMYTVGGLQLAIGDMTWNADVTFCDPWPEDFPNLLGVEGFFRHFRVTIRAVDFVVEIERETW
ncbi:MAG: hypothetical protein ACRD2A_06040 [Vicinamibacterales bacterium]